MLTMLGALLVLFSCASFAARRVLREQRRIRAAEELRQGLFCLKKRLDFSMEPLPALLEGVAQEELGDAGEFFHELAVGLTDGGNRPLDEVWRETLHEYAKKTGLHPSTVRILKKLGSRLGKLAGEAEIDSLERTEKELEAEIKQEQQEFAKSSRLLKSAGVLVGILIVVLFL